MSNAESESAELTYSLGTAARLTGLSPELLRAWERRYGVVQPMRTPGGTRRYRAADLERLRLVKAVVDAGHRIGQVAQLDARELKQRAVASEPAPAAGHLDEILAALERLDAVEAHRLLSGQLSILGPVRFAREVAVPLVHEIGERWNRDRMAIASEHLATGVLRSLLGSAVQPSAASMLGPRIVFATPSGERHELGLQMAALTAMGAGASPICLGAELPTDEMLAAVGRTGAAALGIGLVTIPVDEAAEIVAKLRAALPADVRLWLGGPRAGELAPTEGVEAILSLDELEQRVALLGFESPARR